MENSKDKNLLEDSFTLHSFKQGKASDTALVEVGAAGLASAAAAYALPTIGVITSIDDLIGTFKEQSKKPFYDYDSAIEVHFLTESGKTIYTTFKIVAGGISITTTAKGVY